MVVLPYIVPLANSTSAVPSKDLVDPSGRFLIIGKDQIYVEDQGPGSNEAVVFIHGFGGSTFTWRNNIPFLVERGFRVVALDLKGFGLSSRDPNSDYSHPGQAEIIAEVLTQLQITRVYLIGHSNGQQYYFTFCAFIP